MSFEDGHRPEHTDRGIVGTVDQRRAVYDAAMRTVCFNPEILAGYDDTPKNLLLRSAGPQPEIVKLDAANWQTDHPA